MATTANRAVRYAYPITYRRRRIRRTNDVPWGAWALFLAVGVPLGLMAALSFLARAGIYVDFFRPFWQPWPPDLWKPILGIAGFIATFAYLAYRHGERSGFRSGALAGIATARKALEAHYRRTELPAPPPPPPPRD